ncbi:MAG: sodium:proton antiporter [Flavobacteriaceae bacterium]|nr:sodium:proton antiporter [Bacteroidia bacterium]NNF81769.1 sodium:proton antiporter [Flavobacteriaceae bacterium]NNK69979.1 sodium:proton antiporter [Flavobacteriaceae bacterium]NNL80907.1 sodium:proton antiporter [Flavobacteriaceae bacterium]
MSDDNNIKEIKIEGQNIIENIELNIWEALIPVFALVGLLAYNIFFSDGELLGEYSNQYILLIGGGVAAIVGFFNKVGVKRMMTEIWENWKSIFIPVMILFLVGALAGTWLVSGVIPAMVYYGLQVLSPEIFLPACIVIAALISIATGSSWTTSATVGIALIGIGTDALGMSGGVVAGAIISGAYFGDKMSPMSDTTNLAPAMAGTDLFTHIRYMTYTTVPSILIALIVFFIISFNIETTGSSDVSGFLNTIDSTFNINPWLFVVPGAVIALILMKTKPLKALGAGVLLAAVFAFIFQAEVLSGLGSSNFGAVVQSIFTDTQIVTDNEKLNDLFSSGGMKGMLWTIFLIICAMVFGGVMDAIGALARITKALLSVASTLFGLFASTVISCLGLNTIASDQYLAIVIPGKMFKKAFDDRGLAPENLSRTLEDSGTVTSVLIPWNTCGAYQSGVLGVSVGEYFVYAIFNWISPFTTLVYAAFRIKIKMALNKSV